MTTLNDFIDYIGPSDSLYRYNKSYKLVFLINMLNLVDEEGKIRETELYENIKDYYLNRYNSGFDVELGDSEIQKNIDKLSFEIVSRVMNSNPYVVISEKGFIEKVKKDNIKYIKFNKDLWSDLQHNRKELIRLLKQKLQLYYETYIKDDNMKSFRGYLEYIMNRYNNARISEDFKGHELGNILRHEVPNFIEKLSIINNNRYYAKGTIGAGGWTKTPWIAVLDKKINATMQEGVYIVYLFSSDMERVYLTLNQGVTNYNNEHSKTETVDYLEGKAIRIRKYFDNSSRAILNNNIILEGTSIADLYEKGTIAYIEYKKNQLPEEERLIKDLDYFLGIYRSYADDILSTNGVQEKAMMLDDIQQINFMPKSNKEIIDHIKKYISSKGFTYEDNEIENLYLSLRTKPFVILSGISGTGKTKIVELFAEAIGATNANGRFRLIPVKPNWSDSSDLIGYKDINGNFQPGPLTRIIIEALKEENKDKPFFICLDEMNLARVEYYFSDLLSILETRRKDISGRIITNYIIDKDYLETESDNKIYGQLAIPENLYFIGTVNMDETTYPFSKKVLDRANTIEFTNIDLGIIPTMNKKEIEKLRIGNSFLKSNYTNIKDIIREDEEYVKSIIENLIEINNLLKSANFHVGYRVRDEFCMFMLYNKRLDLICEDDAFDMQLMQKILPRIQGSSREIYRLLVNLFNFSSKIKLNENEIDLGNEAIKLTLQTPNPCKYKKTSLKIAHMLRRYEEDGFTSFWI